MMRPTLALAAAVAVIPAPVYAQSAPYKLVISWYQSNLTVVEYPSKARCEAAARALNEEVDRRTAETLASMPAGSVPVGKSPNGAFCIPG